MRIKGQATRDVAVSMQPDNKNKKAIVLKQNPFIKVNFISLINTNKKIEKSK